MTKVMVFVSSMHGGGAERVAALLANQWVSDGSEVVLVATFSGGGECVYPLDDEVSLVYLADTLSGQGTQPVQQVKRLLALRKCIKDFQPTILVSFLSRVNVAVMLASVGLGIHTVVAECTYPPQVRTSAVFNWLRARLYARADSVVMQTHKGLQWLQQISPKSHGLVIANPVVYPVPSSDPQIPPDDVVAQDKRLIVAVGRLVELKGFLVLIDAFARLADTHPAWCLVVLGEGPQRSELETEIARQGLQDRVFLPGHVGNVATWHTRAELFVLSSRYEGFPNALVEAMAHGVAVVSFDCDTGPADIITHHQDGLLVDPVGGAVGLSEAMSSVIADEDLMQRLGESAKQVRERLAMPVIAQDWQNALAPPS